MPWTRSSRVRPLLAAVALALCPTTPARAQVDVPADPLGVGDAGVVDVDLRERGEVRELRAVGIIDAPTDVVFSVICDVKSARELVPHLGAFRVLVDHGDSALAYQRLEVPTMTPRDFTLRHSCRTEKDKEGHTLRVNEWRTDNSAGPPSVDGVIRLELNEGSWVLEEIDGGRRTRATYRLRIDPRGDVPAFIMSTAMKMQVPELYKKLTARCTRAVRMSSRE
jgi:hypothetical protein